MSEEKNVAKLAQLKSDVEGLIRDFNDHNQNGKVAEAVKSTADMDEKIGEYTSIVRDMCFDACIATENPMLTAVETLSYMTLGYKDEEDKETKIVTRKLIEKERQIDLLKLHKYAIDKKSGDGTGIGANKNWAHIAQKMNFLLTAQKCKDLGVPVKDVNDSYAMSEIAREFDMGKNPTSNTKMLATLRTVIGAMLGDEFAKKANSHDVQFLLSVYAKKNRKALTVSCANHKYFRGYLLEVCHRIATGKSYSVEFKRRNDNTGTGSNVTTIQTETESKSEPNGKGKKSESKTEKPAA